MQARVSAPTDGEPAWAGDHDPTRPGPTAAFVLEQTLGHITHSANLRALIPQVGRLQSEFLPIAFDPGRWRVPGWNNWTVRAGLRAHRAILRLAWSSARRRPDVMFVHTQVPAVLLGPWMRLIPTVVSLDATPAQYDELGDVYAHSVQSGSVERVKHRINRRCFQRAAHLVTWSEWARQSLVADYGIDPERITVIAPGVDIERWRSHPRSHTGRPVRILFVGTDLQRKGGDLLVDVVRRLRDDASLPDLQLDLVTGADVDDESRIVVHRGLTANTPELVALYHAADIFCLPTRGDCLPMVLAEAAAAGLPLVSTDVGAIHEIVRPGITGELTRPGDAEGLTAVLRDLVLDRDRRRRYGTAARALAERDHDARANAAAIVGILDEHARRPNA